jgi:hypothetical protein
VGFFPGLVRTGVFYEYSRKFLSPSQLTTWYRATLEQIVEQIDNVSQIDDVITIGIPCFRRIGSCLGFEQVAEQINRIT